MRNIFFFFVLTLTTIYAQEFKAIKVSGNVYVLQNTREDYIPVVEGATLKAEDLLITEKASSIRLEKEDGLFFLKSESALPLNFLKKITINDLLLALTLEEIRSVPKTIKSEGLKTTAVYGSKEISKISKDTPDDFLGERIINGARQLADAGYKESAVLVAKETFRKHPVTKNSFENRIYFADLLSELGLYQEAITDYNSIMQLTLSDSQKEIVDKRVEENSVKLIK